MPDSTRPTAAGDLVTGHVSPERTAEVYGQLAQSADYDALPPIGTYWTKGALITARHMVQEAYLTCARCGAFVNTADRHDDWHRAIERVIPPGKGDA
jgi:hypothetical protein